MFPCLFFTMCIFTIPDPAKLKQVLFVVAFATLATCNAGEF